MAEWGAPLSQGRRAVRRRPVRQLLWFTALRSVLPLSDSALTMKQGRTTLQVGCPGRSWWGYVLLAIAVALQVVTWTGHLRFFTSPSPGLVILSVQPGDNEFIAVSATRTAREQVGHDPGMIVVRRINGRSPIDVPPGHPYRAAITSWLDLDAGGTNTFLVAEGGRLSTVRLPVVRPDLAVWYSHPLAYFPLLSLLYLVSGALVWWRRHDDRAALPLLAFATVASVELSTPAGSVWVGQLFDYVAFSSAPLYGAAGLWLALEFTGVRVRPSARGLAWVVLVVSVVLAVVTLFATTMVLHAEPSYEALRRAAVTATGAHLIGSIVVLVAVCWLAARPPHPLGLRRRARMMAKAVVIAFLVPSGYILVEPFLSADARRPMGIIVLLLMGSFPVMLGYAIVQHRMFDLRIVVRQGVVYGALSLAVTLAYLGLVVGGFGVLGHRAESPLAIGLLAVVLVLVASLLKLKVQHLVDRVVFRGRYAYADAVARASAELARARTLEAISDTVRGALIEGMQLARVYFAVRSPEVGTNLACYCLGNRPDPKDGRLPPELPRELEPERCTPVQRVLTTLRMAAAFDSSAASAQGGRSGAVGPDVTACHDEASFWSHFGIECIVPVTIGEAERRARLLGVILLGPKLDERQLDPEDQQLITTLANQLAVALDHTAAFHEIEQLKRGLEAQVEERTRELREALESLGQARSHLIESQQQAMLGRLVAGIIHEVNSPLGAVSSSADTIRRSLERAREYLCDQRMGDVPDVLRAIGTGQELTEVIRGGSIRIGSLMDSLSRLTTLDQAELKTCDVRAGLESALLLLRPQLGDEVRIARVFPSQPVTVRASPGKLNQVFLHLLQNAATAVGDRGCIHVSLVPQVNAVRIVIEDDGCGISPEVLARVFDFTFTTKQGRRVGLGLGLPLSKRTVEELGGTLEIDSELGRGTRVTAVVPTLGGSAPGLS